jgi:uncharacterized protein YndB with AHSA1/START domain
VAKIWAALTEPARLARWSGPTIDVRRDGEVVLADDRGFVVDLVPEKRLVWAIPQPNGGHSVFHIELAPWTWPTTEVTRFALTVRGAPEHEIGAIIDAWMQGLHDLADAASA